jgi:hypothetical protein
MSCSPRCARRRPVAGNLSAHARVQAVPYFERLTRNRLEYILAPVVVRLLIEHEKAWRDRVAELEAALASGSLCKNGAHDGE